MPQTGVGVRALPIRLVSLANEWGSRDPWFLRRGVGTAAFIGRGAQYGDIVRHALKPLSASGRFPRAVEAHQQHQVQPQHQNEGRFAVGGWTISHDRAAVHEDMSV